MARYSKIDRRIHSDEKFNNLSPPQPCGRYLFFWLLTAPNLSAVPGAFRCGESAMADEIGWSLEGFREAFAEVLREGMVKADWKARFVWLPNACKYNAPESPNVVRSWRIPWDELPECALKNEVWQTLKDFTQGLGNGFAKAFDEACPKPSAKTLANQEPEPEQKQKPVIERVGIPAARARKPPPIAAVPEPQQPPPPPPTHETVSSPKPDPAKLERIRAALEVATNIPADWEPDEPTLERLRMDGILQPGQRPPREVVVAFRAHHEAQGTLRIKRLWGAEFAKWMARQRTYDTERAARNPAPKVYDKPLEFPEDV